MDSTDQYRMSSLGNDDSPFVFEDYQESFRNGSVAAYLREHGKEFDAVATFNTSGYDEPRAEIQAEYTGPIIIFESVYRDVPGDFTRVRMSILPSDFNELIRNKL